MDRPNRRPKDQPVPGYGGTSIRLLPTRGTWRYLQERAERQQAVATVAAGVVGRGADDPVVGRIVVHQQDERDARYGKPLMVADIQPGKRPILAVGGGGEHTERLIERIEEERHYKFDEEPLPYEMTDWQAVGEILREKARNRLAGRTVYGYGTSKGKMTV